MVETTPQLAEIIQRYRRELEKMNIRCERIWLFGSQVDGTAHEGSDIDILVEMDPADGNLLMRASGLLEETRQLFGRDDIDIIAPAVSQLRKQGIEVRGPLSAATMFHAAARKTHDCAICLYHDQALIPIKTIAFDEGVNVTLGLPFVPTSPDHGTAYDIAGKGIARPDSLIAALKLAARLARAQASAPA